MIADVVEAETTIFVIFAVIARAELGEFALYQILIELHAGNLRKLLVSYIGHLKPLHIETYLDTIACPAFASRPEISGAGRKVDAEGAVIAEVAERICIYEALMSDEADVAPFVFRPDGGVIVLLRIARHRQTHQRYY